MASAAGIVQRERQPGQPGSGEAAQAGLKTQLAVLEASADREARPHGTLQDCFGVLDDRRRARPRREIRRGWRLISAAVGDPPRATPIRIWFSPILHRAAPVSSSRPCAGQRNVRCGLGRFSPSVCFQLLLHKFPRRRRARGTPPAAIGRCRRAIWPTLRCCHGNRRPSMSRSTSRFGSRSWPRGNGTPAHKGCSPAASGRGLWSCSGTRRIAWSKHRSDSGPASAAGSRRRIDVSLAVHASGSHESGRRAGGTAQVSLRPLGQHQHGPQHAPVPAGPGQMGLVQGADGGLGNPIRHGRTGGQHRAFKHLPQRPAQPVVDRDLESLLAVLQDLRPGSRSRASCLNSHFVSPPRTFKSDGIDAASSRNS